MSAKTTTSTGVPGVKLLIAAASCAATIGGWAVLSNTQAQPVSQSAPAAPAPQTTARQIDLKPLPTLIPPPDPNSLAIKAPVVARANPQPAAAPAPAPQISGLRVVNAPIVSAPDPVARTQSSK